MRNEHPQMYFNKIILLQTMAIILNNQHSNNLELGIQIILFGHVEEANMKLGQTRSFNMWVRRFGAQATPTSFTLLS